MTENEKCWLAGILEGEGSFMKGAPSCQNRPSIKLQMTDRDVVERVALLLQVRHISAIQPQKLHHKPSFTVCLRGERAVDAMIVLRPLMGQRRQSQIDKAVENYKRPSKPQSLAHGTHAMYNKGGCRCASCRVGHREYMKQWRKIRYTAPEV